MTSSESEIKAVKEVMRILVMPTLGTGSNDPEKVVNKTVPAGAYRRYEENMILTSGLSNSLKTLGFDEALAEVLPINWSAEFYRWVKDLKGPKPKKDAMHLNVPTYGKKIAKSEKDLKKLAKAIKKRDKALEPVAKAMKENLGQNVADAQEKAKKPLVPVENLLRHMGNRLGITYLLVSYFDGSQEAFDKDLPMTLHVAMVNVETGKMRYYSQSTGKKSDLPTTLEGLLGMMVVNLFDNVEEFDKIEF